MSCVFCEIAAKHVPAEVVYEDSQTMAFLDTRPVFFGHTLVIPRTHTATLPEIESGLIQPFFETVKLLSAAVPIAMDAEGSLVAINNVVSQSVPHLHAHVVPRRKGDGLRGFFWPRTKYDSSDQMRQTCERIRAAIK